MLQRLKRPAESYRYQLGAALNMEQTVLEILAAAIDEAQDQQVEAMFARHRAQSEGHVRTLEEVFRQMGWEIVPSPCPAVEGLQAEGKANAMKCDSSTVDAMLLQGSVAVEHYEIAVYENLIDGARAMGQKRIVELLTRNLESEQQALRLVRSAHQKVMADSFPAKGGMLNRLKAAMGK